MMHQAGLLLVNLGTPAGPTAREVRPYLRQFLSDPRVLNMAPFLRFLLLELVILRVRPYRSARAYRTIWTERGSPLLFHTRDLAEKVADRLPHVHVDFAMRYGEPSIESAFLRMREAGIERITVMPLYPQYSSASTGSTVEECMRLARKLWAMPSLAFVPPFYDAPPFLDAFAATGRREIADFKPDHVLMSYHGLPEDHVQLGDMTQKHCLRTASCCDVDIPANRLCYRRHCIVTSRALSERLSLQETQYTVTFQSRFTNGWLKPFTDVEIEHLAKQGTRRLLVFCPAFVADCLETLEEIQLRAKEDFVKAGGEDLRLVPSLNAEDVWADAVVALAKDASAWLHPRHFPVPAASTP